MFTFDYKQALYRKNNHDQPCVWFGEILNDYSLTIYHGIIGKKITKETIITNRKAKDELESKIRDKRKSGYKLLVEVKDDSNAYPVGRELLAFLTTYLPTNRTTADGSLLPMLAKTYDNSNNKLFKRISAFMGQYKINGLRCFISAEPNNGDMFRPIRLRFQSREGTYWNSLDNLEDYLIENLNYDLLNKMIEEHYILDGELYLPGHSVNEINHFVKDSNCKENALLQYWCYDLAIDNMSQVYRLSFLEDYIEPTNFNSLNSHLNNTDRLIVLPHTYISSDSEAIGTRNTFINWGFEGLILRNPDAEYQFGKRNQSMIKFKKSTDGKFIIVDIKPEGAKRPDIPLFICKNDINDKLFECHVGGSLDYQRDCLINKEEYIGKYMFVEYGERSGVDSLPFHVKTTYIMNV